MTATIPESPAFDLTAVVEIVELKSSRMVNSYLEAGYRLLAISGMARMVSERGREMSHVRRWAQYTLGRPAEVEHADIAPPWFSSPATTAPVIDGPVEGE